MRRKLTSAAMCLALVLSVAIFQAWSAEEPKYDGTYGSGDSAITLATGSPGALGLLRALAEPFCAVNECRVNWIKKGSGASLEALKAGQVDMVMVHAPAAEKKP
jgi:tungstate transport system substrate-binding protein